MKENYILMKQSFSKDKAANMSIVKRVHAGKCLTAFEATIYLSAMTALVVATAVFLWHPKESDSKNEGSMACNKPYTVVESSPYNSFKYDEPCEKDD